MEMLPAAQPKSQFTPDHIGRSLLLCARGTHVAVGSRRGEKCGENNVRPRHNETVPLQQK